MNQKLQKSSRHNKKKKTLNNTLLKQMNSPNLFDKQQIQ